MASGSLGLAVTVDAVLFVLAFFWLVLGAILKDEQVLSISMAWVGGPLIVLLIINIAVFLFAFLTSKTG